MRRYALESGLPVAIVDPSDPTSNGTAPATTLSTKGRSNEWSGMGGERATTQQAVEADSDTTNSGSEEVPTSTEEPEGDAESAAEEQERRLLVNTLRHIGTSVPLLIMPLGVRVLARVCGHCLHCVRMHACMFGIALSERSGKFTAICANR
jgi:hypothetical protein